MHCLAGRRSCCHHNTATRCRSTNNSPQYGYKFQLVNSGIVAVVYAIVCVGVSARCCAFCPSFIAHNRAAKPPSKAFYYTKMCAPPVSVFWCVHLLQSIMSSATKRIEINPIGWSMLHVK